MGQIDAILLLLPGTIRIFLGKIFETDELTDVRLGRFQRYDSHVSVFPRSGHKQTDLHSTSLGRFQRYDFRVSVFPKRGHKKTENRNVG